MPTCPPEKQKTKNDIILHPSPFILHFGGGGTAVLFIISLLSHESAVLFGAFAALIHITDPECALNLKSELRNPKSILRRHPWLMFLALGGLYAILYQFLPISRAPQGGADAMGGLWVRLLYVLQSGSYPFAWFAHVFPNLRADGIALGSVALTLALVIWRLAASKSAWRPLVLGWGWWLVAALVIVAPLSTGYLLHGPRLLYLGSVGVSVGWGQLFVGNNQQSTVNSQRDVFQFGRLGLLAFVLAASLLFVRGRLADYERLAQPVRVMQEVVAARPSTQNILFVNLPQWLAPPRNTYAVGVEFVSMLGDYLFVEELAWENGAAAQTAVAVRLPDLLAQTDYGYAVHEQSPLSEVADLTEATAVIQTQFAEDGVTAVYRGSWQSGAGGEPADVLGPYQLLDGMAETCDGQTAVTFTWQIENPTTIPPTTSLFVQLFDDAGQLVAQADGPPLGLRADLLPSGPLWITDVRQMPGVHPQPVKLLVGAYDFVSGERLAGTDGGGRPLPDDAFILEFICEP
ncbi:MAG: hypothetical protein ACE5EY_15820 [Anaerolineae bacterium]